MNERAVRVWTLNTFPCPNDITFFFVSLYFKKPTLQLHLLNEEFNFKNQCS